ncbi:MAG TPA: FAD-dependent monooxygenase [Myxococcota bacterium]|jgi:flavin-dependent dehydrogenase
MESVDVLIVGGGPAGSSLALGLRGSGLHVRVMDRAVFPRDKTCAGWVTPPVWRALAVDLAEYAAGGRTLQPLRGFQVGRMGGKLARASGDAVVSHGIRRCELDAFLLARCGAEQRLGDAVRTLERSANGWCVNGTLHARLLVGAGGHFCPVARALMASEPKEPPIAAQEIELPLSDEQAAQTRIDPERPEIWFLRDLSGYAWAFRKGRFLNVGLGRHGGADLHAQLLAFLGAMQRAGRVPASWDGAAHGHAYLTYGATRRPLQQPGVALIGDAAGLAYPKSGEGIRPAVESGLLLARALRRARDVADPGALEEYERALIGRFGPRRVARGGTSAPRWQAALARPLFARAWFARHVIVDRWFLNSGQAALPA